MQSEIFAPTWFSHFIKYAKPTEDDSVLLICDGHSTHVKNLNLILMARESNVHILIIPPHTSHRLQPLDVAFMYPLSSYYSQGVQNWLRNNPGKVVTIHEVSTIFGQAYMRAATIENALSGFKQTGIFPYDNHIFPDIAFAAAEVTDCPITEINANIAVENIHESSDNDGSDSSEGENDFAIEAKYTKRKENVQQPPIPTNKFYGHDSFKKQNVSEANEAQFSSKKSANSAATPPREIIIRQFCQRYCQIVNGLPFEHLL